MRIVIKSVLLHLVLMLQTYKNSGISTDLVTDIRCHVLRETYCFTAEKESRNIAERFRK